MKPEDRQAVMKLMEHKEAFADFVFQLVQRVEVLEWDLKEVEISRTASQSEVRNIVRRDFEVALKIYEVTNKLRETDNVK